MFQRYYDRGWLRTRWLGYVVVLGVLPPAPIAAEPNPDEAIAQYPPEVPTVVQRVLRGFRFVRLVEVGKGGQLTGPAPLVLGEHDEIAIDKANRLLLEYQFSEDDAGALRDAGFTQLCLTYNAVLEGSALGAVEQVPLEVGKSYSEFLQLPAKSAQLTVAFDVRPSTCDKQMQNVGRRLFRVVRVDRGLKPLPTVTDALVVYGHTRIGRARDQVLRPGVNVFFVDESRNRLVAILAHIGLNVSLPDVNPNIDKEWSIGIVACPTKPRVLCAGGGWNVGGKVKNKGWVFLTVSGLDLRKALEGK